MSERNVTDTAGPATRRWSWIGGAIAAVVLAWLVAEFGPSADATTAEIDGQSGAVEPQDPEAARSEQLAARRAASDHGASFDTRRLSQHYWTEGAGVGDIDRDGALDIVAGPYWYAGPGFEESHEYYPATESFERRKADGSEQQVPGFEGALGVENEYTDNFIAHVYDFDEDGWQDILTLGFPGEQAAWYRNPQGSGRWTRHVMLEPLDNESPGFVDIDGDDRPDILATSKGYVGYATRNDRDPAAAWTFHRISPHGEWDAYTHGLGAGDVNGDGRADIIEANAWWEQPASLAGDPQWTRHPVELGYGAQFHAYDVNDDGLPDIVGSIEAHGYGLAWWEQVRAAGEAISFRRHLILGTEQDDGIDGVEFSQLHAVGLADIDGDGLKDIVTGKRFLAHGWDEDPDARGKPVVYWFKLTRDGGDVAFEPHLIDDESGIGVDVVIADVNDDGLEDIVTANKSGLFVHTQEFGGYSPEDAARAMSLPEGFTATAFAGEPDIRQPIGFAIDDRGRLWVAEAYTYPVRRPEGEGTDRILVFEDTDRDGQFDRRTVFKDQLNLVSGIEVGFGGLWVGAAPHLLYIPIADGDAPRPAGEAEVILDGWGWEDTHETLNTFRWGPDGWLYGAHGIFTHSKVGVPGTPDSERVVLDAAIWRYHPTKKRFEIFAEGTSNPWGYDFDAHGRMIAEACVIAHLWHLQQGGRYLRQRGSPDNLTHFNPYTYADIDTIADHLHFPGGNPYLDIEEHGALGGGHAHAGLMIYQGGAWPESYGDYALINNIHGAQINMDELLPKGSGFVGAHRPSFIKFNDPWSQIVNLQYDHDGAVYMIDWYDQEQCHVEDPGIPDRGNGRIFKLSYGDTPATDIDMQSRSDAELLTDLLERREWRVRHAGRVLQERAATGKLDAGVAETLRALLGLGGTAPKPPLSGQHRDSASSEAQLRVLWALHSIGGLDETDAMKLTARDDEYLRAWAIQLAAEDEKLSDTAVARLAELAQSDPSPIVRLYLASAALRIAPGKRWRLVEALHARADDTEDQNLPFLNWYALEPLAAEDPARMMDIALASRMPRTLEFSARRLIAEDKEPAVAAVVDGLKRAESDAQQLAILSGMSFGMRGRVDVPIPDGWTEAETAVRASAPDESVQRELLAVSLFFGSSEAFVRAREVVADPDAEMATRVSALDSLVEARDPKLLPLLPGLFHEEPPLRGAAIRATGAYADPDTPERLLEIYPSLSASEKRDVVAVLGSRPEYAEALGDAMHDRIIPPSEVSADVVRQVRGFNLPDTTALVEFAWDGGRDRVDDIDVETARYAALVEAGANAADTSNGRRLYGQVCGACHRLFGEGGNIGPDITGSNRSDLDYLLRNILQPNAEIVDSYLLTTLTLSDGRVLSGFADDNDSPFVTMTTTGGEMRIPRSEVAGIEQSDVSMMPEGLLTPLSDAEVRDLIAYLRSPQQVPLP